MSLFIVGQTYAIGLQFVEDAKPKMSEREHETYLKYDFDDLKEKERAMEPFKFQYYTDIPLWEGLGDIYPDKERQKYEERYEFLYYEPFMVLSLVSYYAMEIMQTSEGETIMGFVTIPSIHSDNSPFFKRRVYSNISLDLKSLRRT